MIVYLARQAYGSASYEIISAPDNQHKLLQDYEYVQIESRLWVEVMPLIYSEVGEWHRPNWLATSYLPTMFGKCTFHSVDGQNVSSVLIGSCFMPRLSPSSMNDSVAWWHAPRSHLWMRMTHTWYDIVPSRLDLSSIPWPNNQRDIVRIICTMVTCCTTS